MFYPGSRASGGAINYYETMGAFTEQDKRLIKLGITETGLHFPTIDAQRPVLEKIASEAIPHLKAKNSLNRAHPNGS